MTTSHGVSPRRRCRAPAAALAVLAALLSGETAAQAPQAPATGPGACPAPPETPALLDARFPKQKSEAPDREALAFNRQSMASLSDFIKRLERLGDDAMGGDRAAAACFGTSLDAWVRTDPITLPRSDQAHFEQSWALGSIALAMIKAESAGVKSTPAVKRWLRSVSDGVRAFHNARPFTNNHAAWAALSVGSAAYILHDDEAWRWAIARESIVTDQLQDDGTLPRELARGPKASSYHLFTAMPLVALNLIQSCRGGVEPAQAEGVRRLLALLGRIEQEPQLLAARAGAEQGVARHYPLIRILRGEDGGSFNEPKLGGEATNLRKALARCR